MKLLALVLAFAACGPALVEPIRPEPFAPGPAQFAAAAHVTNCSGVTVTATEVNWYVVEGIAGHPDALGAWNPPRDIYLLPVAVEDEVVSGHELLHHVLRGDFRHRDARWESCGLTADGWVLAAERSSP